MVDVSVHDLPHSLPSDIFLCLFRVLQESLHNAVKHCGVRTFDGQLSGTSDEIHLTVSDCGVGFNLETARKGGGLASIAYACD
jgi:signal transduction histidine kinase